MIRHFTYQLAIFIVIGPILIVYGIASGRGALVAGGIVATALGVAGYLHGRKDE